MSISSTRRAELRARRKDAVQSEDFSKLGTNRVAAVREAHSREETDYTKTISKTAINSMRGA